MCGYIIGSLVVVLLLMLEIRELKKDKEQIQRWSDEWKGKYFAAADSRQEVLNSARDLVSISRTILDEFRSRHIRVQGGTLEDHKKRMAAWTHMSDAISKLQRQLEGRKP